MTNQNQKQLGKTLWNIPGQLRGAMNAGDFRDYLLTLCRPPSPPVAIDHAQQLEQFTGTLDDTRSFLRISEPRVALAAAVWTSKARFPRIGGILLWCGHDCYPCPANTSIIDFHGNPKPAALALKAIWNAVLKGKEE